MQSIEYKGLIIKTIMNTFVVFNATGTQAVLKPEGYATLNHAKGAITKHIKALEAIQKPVEAVQAPSVSVSPSTPVKTAVKPVKAVLQSRNKREGRFLGWTNKRAVRMVASKDVGLQSYRMTPANRKQRKYEDILDREMSSLY